MNNAQRLFTLCAITAGFLMMAIPPFLVYGSAEGNKWIVYSFAWEQPYPSVYNPIMKTPYCPEGHPFYLLLLVQLLVLVIGGSYVNGRLGKLEDVGGHYPEYFRP